MINKGKNNSKLNLSKLKSSYLWKRLKRKITNFQEMFANTCITKDLQVVYIEKFQTQ